MYVSGRQQPRGSAPTLLAGSLSSMEKRPVGDLSPLRRPFYTAPFRFLQEQRIIVRNSFRGKTRRSKAFVIERTDYSRSLAGFPGTRRSAARWWRTAGLGSRFTKAHEKQPRAL